MKRALRALLLAEDFTLVFLAELVLGLSVFCLLSFYAYGKIKRYRKDVAFLRSRLEAAETSLKASHEDLQVAMRESENRVSSTELEHALSLFSMHVLHHLPKPKRSTVASTRRHLLKHTARSK